MREIKFRGKTSSGHWKYGELVMSPTIDPAIYFEVGNGSVKQMDWVYVNPDTIGQFTGLRDANGREIYEGDVLRPEDEEKAYGVVVWHPNGYFAIDPHFGKYKLKDRPYRPIGEMLNYELRQGKHLRFVVCGNIHDKAAGYTCADCGFFNEWDQHCDNPEVNLKTVKEAVICQYFKHK